jgi:hypothetical protein
MGTAGPKTLLGEHVLVDHGAAAPGGWAPLVPDVAGAYEERLTMRRHGG